MFELDNFFDERIITFNYDSDENKILLCLKQLRQENMNRIVIYDMELRSELKMIFNYVLKEGDLKEVYGRLQLGNYRFIGGHIYYGNSAIKVRYDLMQSKFSINYSAEQLFDVYNDLFELKDEYKMLVNGPFVSYSMNKLVYIIKSTK